MFVVVANRAVGKVPNDGLYLAYARVKWQLVVGDLSAFEAAQRLEAAAVCKDALAVHRDKNEARAILRANFTKVVAARVWLAVVAKIGASEVWMDEGDAGESLAYLFVNFDVGCYDESAVVEEI